MTYAHITNNAIDTVGRLPKAARRLDTSAWVLGLADAPTELREACGWFEVVDTVQPADTSTRTYERSVQIVAGVPTVSWSQRAKTQAEKDSDTQSAVSEDLRTRARQSIAANLTAIGQIPTGVAAMDAIIAANASNQDVTYYTLAQAMKRSLSNQERILKQLIALERLLVGSDLLLSDEGTN